MNKKNVIFNKPKVSVIMPCYNGEKFIAEAIQSVLNQTYQNWELIIVDDGSIDNSKNVIDQYLSDPRIHYVRHSKNMGIPAARNTGIRASNGEFIALLDDDDKWVPYKLSLQLEEFYKSKPEFGLAFGNIIIIDSNGFVIRKSKNLKIDLKQLTHKEILKHLFLDNFISSITAVFKRECIREVGEFDEDIIWGVDDYDLCLRIVSKFKIIYINRVLAIRREHDNNYSDSEKSAKGKIQIIKKRIKEYPFLNNLANKKSAQCLYQLGRLKHFTSNFKEARKFYLKAIYCCPTISLKPYITYLLALLKINFTYKKKYIREK